MSERAYQRRMLESENRIVMCDWDRGKGKTYSITRHILDRFNCNTRRKSNIVIVTMNSYLINVIHDFLKEELSDRYEIRVRENSVIHIGEYFKYTKKLINDVEVTEDKYIELLKIKVIGENSIDSIRGMKFDYVYCDEYIPSSNEIALFRNSLVNQIYVLGTFNVEYISDKEMDINENDWIEQQVKELMQEFGGIPKAENTTKRREVVLNMIRELKQLKNSNSLYCQAACQDIEVGGR